MAIELESEQQRYQDANEARERYAAMYPQLDARRRLQDQLRNADLRAAGLERRNSWERNRAIETEAVRRKKELVAWYFATRRGMQSSLTRRNGLIK